MWQEHEAAGPLDPQSGSKREEERGGGRGGGGETHGLTSLSSFHEAQETAMG